MSKRVDLGNKLKEILGSNNVYFQPPDNLKMVYPCIRYRLEGGNAEYADNVTTAFPDNMNSYSSVKIQIQRLSINWQCFLVAGSIGIIQQII